jgi:Signal transduction histidine kinase
MAANSGPLSEAISPPHTREKLSFRFYYLLLILTWTAVIALSLYHNVKVAQKHALDSATIQARTAFEKDLALFAWSDTAQVLYALASDAVKPNTYLGYLSLKDRDVEIGNQRLTRLIPPYLVRLLHEGGSLNSGVNSHLTSLNPLRPQNSPDPWENLALERIEKENIREVREVQTMDDKDYLRFMGALEVRENCLTCHAYQGYKVGDIRGGVSVSVPMSAFEEGLVEQMTQLFTTHALLWLLGAVAVAIALVTTASRQRERDMAEQQLRHLTVELEQRVHERTTDLNRRQRELNALIDNANAGVYMKDVTGMYLIANERFAQIFDRPLDLVIGRQNYELLEPKLADTLSSHEISVMETRTAAELKNALITHRGIRYSCFSFPVLENGEVVALGGLLVDMTEREQAETALRKARDAAEAANKAKSNFLANMSHEIRTPLNGLIGMADLLLRTRLTADQASMAAAIKTSGDSLLVVLNDILDISKVAAGKLVLEKMPFNLREMLYNAAKSLTPLAYSKSLELILHISPQVPEQLVGDPARLRQIILNLVSNSLKFTEEGEVVVTVQPISLNEGSARLRISVSDTGIGIPEAKQRAILNEFEQVDPSTTRKYGGSGLGLAICSRLTEIMGSRLELKSSENYGSTFWFDLELPIDTTAQPGKSVVRFDLLNGRRALIVDDNETNLFVLGESLAQWGVESSTCSSMTEATRTALGAIREGRPYDFVIADFQMPSFTGSDLLETFKANPNLASLPFILLSSGNLSAEITGQVGSDKGFSAIVDKPVRPEMLMRAIASALNIWENYAISDTPEDEQIEAALQPLKVLLVEDVEMNQMVAARMLKTLGHTATIAGDGQQAVNTLLQEDFDLVLMDIQMPVMDGVEATQKIRELEARGAIKKHTHIIAMTAHALKGDKAKYLSAGMDGYLAKPILLETLERALADITGESRTNRAITATQMDLAWSTTQKDFFIRENGKQTWLRDVQPAPITVAPVADTLKNLTAGKVKAEEGETRPEEAETRPPVDNEAPPSPVTPLPQGPHIDWAVVENNFAYDTSLFTDSVHIYLRDAPKLLGKIEEALKTGDSRGLYLGAHALKGITGYFSRGALYELCLAIEKAATAGAIAEQQVFHEQEVARLAAMLAAIIEEMNTYLKNRDGNKDT